MLNCYTHTPALLYFVNGFVVLGLAIYLGRYGTRSSTIIWLRTFFFFSATYNITDSFTRCAQTSGFFDLVLIPFAFANALMVPVLLIFTLHFINKEYLLNNTWLRIFLFTLAGVTLYVFWSTDLFLIHDFAQETTSFGTRLVGAGSQSSLIGLALLAGYIAPIIIMSRYHRHIENPVKKKEVRIVMWALGILVIPGTIVEAILPIIFHTPSFPLGPFTTVITAIMLTYSITRYGLHVFSLNNVTGNVMQVMPGGLVILDHTNTIQYLNDGAAKMLGYEPGQLAEASAKKLFRTAADYGHFQADIIARLGPDKQIASQEIEFMTKAKRTLPVSLNAVSVYTGHDLVNLLISFTDITPLKEAQTELEAEKAGVERKVVERTHELATSQAKLRASVQSLPLGFIMIDTEYNVVAINPAAQRILKITGAIVSSEQLAKKLGGYNLRGLIDECMAERRTSEVKELAVDERYMHLFASPISGEHDTTLGAVLLMEDITEQKVVERSKDEFFSIASHELRTPLTSIRGNTSMMIDYYKQVLKDPGLQGMVHDVHESSIRLIGIVNDFLDVSRLEQGKVSFKFAEVTITDQIKGVAAELAHEAAGKHTVIKLDTKQLDALPHVVADADRLKQIIFNLLGNALKFTENGTITITGKYSGGNVTIHVTDTGRGIPAASQKLLFHKFQQGGASLITRDTAKGTGLGLYISRLMAEGMGGRVWLEKSVEGKGSTFAFTLPAATEGRLNELAKAALAAASTDSATGLTKTKPVS